MKFTLNWRKDRLDTKAGVEAEGIESPAERLKVFTIARVAGGSAWGRSVRLSVSSVG